MRGNIILTYITNRQNSVAEDDDYGNESKNDKDNDKVTNGGDIG